MRNLLRLIREWRDRRFRQRIDRVYFHTDGHGNRFIQGHLYAIKDEDTGQTAGLTACLMNIGLDKAQSIVESTRLEFEAARNNLSQSGNQQVYV